MFRVYLFVVFSVLVHLMMYWGVQYIPANWELAKHQTPIEVEILPTPADLKEDSSAKELVRQVDVEKENLEPIDQLKEKAKLMSEKTQRVKKQSQAKLFGISQNKMEAQSSPKLTNIQRSNSRRAFEENENEKSIEDYMRQGGIPRPNTEASKSSQRIDNVSFGNVTALNTDRHLFYTYYARIEDSIRWQWERKVSQAIEGPLLINGSSAKERWLTRIDIILSAQGEFEKVELLRSSGIPDFDRAVEYAFRQAARFPNPPKEMISLDGKIRLKYMFEVYYRPKFLARP